jgi:hypothetical protein
MLQRLKSIWYPAGYHGRPGKSPFFEGWYFKIITANEAHRWAIIPGVFINQQANKSHAFIQILDGMTNQASYHRFPLESFQASQTDLDIRIGENRFTTHGITLDLNEKDRPIRGEIQFGEMTPWPVRMLSPGVMGPYTFTPFMQTYHGILSFDHSLEGQLNIAGQEIDFKGGRGYIEKDWGQTFPRAYIWMQSNHFQQEASVSASIATIPWLRSWFRGFLVGFYFNRRLFRFTTYTGAKTESLRLSERQIYWHLTGDRRVQPSLGYHRFEIELRAKRTHGAMISAPELSGMEPRIMESLTAEVQVHLKGITQSGKQIDLFQGRGTSAGLEVAGSVEEIVDQIEE